MVMFMVKMMLENYFGGCRKKRKAERAKPLQSPLTGLISRFGLITQVGRGENLLLFGFHPCQPGNFLLSNFRVERLKKKLRAISNIFKSVPMLILGPKVRRWSRMAWPRSTSEKKKKPTKVFFCC